MGGGDHVVAYPHFLLTLSLFLQCLGSVPDPRPTVISHHSSWLPSLCSYSEGEVATD